MVLEALVVHAFDWLGVSRIPRVFSRAGMRTTVLAAADSPVLRSDYVDEPIAAGGGPEQIIEQLRGIVEKTHFAWVLLADDALIAAAAERAGEPWLDGIFPVDHRGSQRGYLLSKFAFLAACRAHGMPLPQSILTASSDAALAAANGIGYPVMLKRDSGFGGSGVRKVHDDAQLLAVLREFGDSNVNVEEFVGGLIGATEVLYDHGAPVCWWSFEKEKRFPAEFGPSAIRRTFDPPELEPVIHGCGAVTGFHGFAALCWIFDPEKRRVALLEMNPRPGSGMHLPLAENMFAEGIRAVLERRSVSSAARVPDGMRYRMFPQDIQRCIAQRDLPGLLAWIPGLPTARDTPWDDPGLLRDQLRRAAYEYFPHTSALGVRALRRVRRQQTAEHSR